MVEESTRYKWVNIIDVIVSDEEKELVQEVFNNAIDALSDDDKKLPQVNINWCHVIVINNWKLRILL